MFQFIPLALSAVSALSKSKAGQSLAGDAAKSATQQGGNSIFSSLLDPKKALDPLGLLGGAQGSSGGGLLGGILGGGNGLLG